MRAFFVLETILAVIALFAMVGMTLNALHAHATSLQTAYRAEALENRLAVISEFIIKVCSIRAEHAGEEFVLPNVIDDYTCIKDTKASFGVSDRGDVCVVRLLLVRGYVMREFFCGWLNETT